METPIRNINPEVVKGDRIICISMSDDSDPITSFTKGTVTNISNDPFDRDSQIINVLWDNGRTLALISSLDSWIKEPTKSK
jgi:hypothetical protein